MKNIRNLAYVFSLAVCFVCSGALSEDHKLAGNSGKIAKLQPLQALTVNMEDFTAVIYYAIAESEEYEVVITIGPNIGVHGTITQQRSTISAGQSYTFSFDHGHGKDSRHSLEISAGYDVLRVSEN